MRNHRSFNIYSGQLVRIHYPEYAKDWAGVILQPEEDVDGFPTGYWLVQVEHNQIILALAPHELSPMNNL
jgi:hypothetical protein